METLKLMTCGQKDDCGDWVEGEGSRKHPGATFRVTTMWDEEVNKDHKLTFFYFFFRIRFVHGSACLRFRALLSSVVSQTGFGRRSAASPAHHHCLAALLFSVRPCFTPPSQAQLGRLQKTLRFVFLFTYFPQSSLCVGSGKTITQHQSVFAVDVVVLFFSHHCYAG